jgi:hypothetical protein
MEWLNFLKKDKEVATSSRFSDFFLYASDSKKEEVFREAARRANEDQRRVFEQSRLKTKAS